MSDSPRLFAGLVFRSYVNSPDESLLIRWGPTFSGPRGLSKRRKRGRNSARHGALLGLLLRRGIMLLSCVRREKEKKGLRIYEHQGWADTVKSVINCGLLREEEYKGDLPRLNCASAKMLACKLLLKHVSDSNESRMRKAMGACKSRQMRVRRQLRWNSVTLSVYFQSEFVAPEFYYGATTRSEESQYFSLKPSNRFY